MSITLAPIATIANRQAKCPICQQIFDNWFCPSCGLLMVFLVVHILLMIIASVVNLIFLKLFNYVANAIRQIRMEQNIAEIVERKCNHTQLIKTDTDG